jgi:branched-chain amino acid transport system ATP-binding protein
MAENTANGSQPAAGPLLTVDAVTVDYGGTKGLDNISLSVSKGEVLAVLGANGAGKTSLLNAVLGMVKVSGGKVVFGGGDVTQTRPAARVRAGMAVVPEGRRVFGSMSVAENLRVGGFTRPKDVRKRVDALLGQFPILASRSKQLAGTLSGGEQQILAIARALAAEPSLLLLDEPSLGLSPIMVSKVYETLEGLKATGLTMVLVEQSLEWATSIAQRVCLLELGHLRLTTAPVSARTDRSIAALYMGSPDGA